MATATIEHDAAAYGLHAKQGGWWLGLLVARDVQTGEGYAATRRLPNVARTTMVSASAAANMAGTSPNGAPRHLAAPLHTFYVTLITRT